MHPEVAIQRLKDLKAEAADRSSLYNAGDKASPETGQGPHSSLVRALLHCVKAPRASLPLPMPIELAALDGLRRLAIVTDDDWPLVLAWFIPALIAETQNTRPVRPRRAKQREVIVRADADLAHRPVRRAVAYPAHNVDDWVVGCAASAVTCLDNLSHIQPWLSDAMCRAVIGDGNVKRMLYTDGHVAVFAFHRVLAFTSMSAGSSRTGRPDHHPRPAQYRSCRPDGGRGVQGRVACRARSRVGQVS